MQSINPNKVDYHRICILLEDGTRVYRFIPEDGDCSKDFFTDVLGNRLEEPPSLDGALPCCEDGGNVENCEIPFIEVSSDFINNNGEVVISVEGGGPVQTEWFAIVDPDFVILHIVVTRGEDVCTYQEVLAPDSSWPTSQEFWTEIENIVGYEAGSITSTCEGLDALRESGEYLNTIPTFGDLGLYYDFGLVELPPLSETPYENVNCKQVTCELSQSPCSVRTSLDECTIEALRDKYSVHEHSICVDGQIKNVWVKLDKDTLLPVLVRDAETFEVYSTYTFVTDCSKCQPPLLELRKSRDVISYTDVGDVITYTVEVENTGLGEATNVILVDSLSPVSPLSDPSGLFSGGVLAPGEITSVTYQYIVTAADITAGIINNTASVTSDQGVEAEDSKDVVLFAPCVATAEFVGGHGNDSEVAYLYDGIRDAASQGDTEPDNSYATRFHQGSEFRIDFDTCPVLEPGTTVRIYWTNFEQDDDPSPSNTLGLDVFLFETANTIESLGWHSIETSAIEAVPTGDQFFEFTINHPTSYIIITPLSEYGANEVNENTGKDPWIYEVEFNGNTNTGTGFII